MGRGHCLLNILGHEAAHRLLFPNRRVNDFVGRWLLAYPTFQAFTAYRRVHFAHHRDELGPDEPDLALYRGYPVPADSWHRKLRRDLVGDQRLEELQGPLVQPPQGQRRGPPDPGRARRDAGRLDRVRGVAGVRRVDPVVVDAVEVLQPPARDRRARWHGALGRPAAHDPRHPPDPARPLPDGAVQHRLAPRPPRRHGRAVAQPPRPARRARAVGLARARRRVPDLPRVLEGVLRRPAGSSSAPRAKPASADRRASRTVVLMRL